MQYGHINELTMIIIVIIDHHSLLRVSIGEKCNFMQYLDPNIFRGVCACARPSFAKSSIVDVWQDSKYTSAVSWFYLIDS